MSLESKFQKDFNKELLRLYPDGIIVVTDPSNIRSFPDRIFLLDNFWGAFETKRGPNATHQPNQDYYIDLLDDMSFGRFVDPNNMKEVLRDLESTLQTR